MGGAVAVILAPTKGKVDAKASHGFTLIEMLTAMAIIVILVLMLTRVFTQGVVAMETGTRNTYRNMNARAVMDYIARELSTAVFEFGTNKTFLSMGYNADADDDLAAFGLEGSDELFFIRPDIEPDKDSTYRSIQYVRYYVNNYLDAGGDPIKRAPLNPAYRFRLMREQSNPSTTGRYSAYFNTSGSDNTGLFWFGITVDGRPAPDAGTQYTMIDGVRTFEVFAYLDAEGESTMDYRSYGNRKLAFLDLYLETMDESDAARAALLAEELGPDHPTVVTLVERSVKRNYRRVFLYNKYGYHDVDW